MSDPMFEPNLISVESTTFHVFFQKSLNFLKQRESEKKAEDWNELAQRNEDRWETDRKRLEKLYGVDMDNKENYNFYIDTTGKEAGYVTKEIKRIVGTS